MFITAAGIRDPLSTASTFVIPVGFVSVCFIQYLDYVFLEVIICSFL